MQNLCELEERYGCNFWFERVNTASNLADEPSRGIDQDVSLGMNDELNLPSLWEKFGMHEIRRGKRKHAKDADGYEPSLGDVP